MQDTVVTDFVLNSVAMDFMMLLDTVVTDFALDSVAMDFTMLLDSVVPDSLLDSVAMIFVVSLISVVMYFVALLIPMVPDFVVLCKLLVSKALCFKFRAGDVDVTSEEPRGPRWKRAGRSTHACPLETNGYGHNIHTYIYVSIY